MNGWVAFGQGFIYVIAAICLFFFTHFLIWWFSYESEFKEIKKRIFQILYIMFLILGIGFWIPGFILMLEFFDSPSMSIGTALLSVGLFLSFLSVIFHALFIKHSKVFYSQKIPEMDF